MDTQNLKAFLSAAKLESFSLAGEQLGLTQPAISKRIFLLESELELKLFDRIGRKIALTEHGHKLVPMAKDILERIDSAKQSLLLSSDAVAGPLSLAISHHIGLHRLPPVLKSFTQRYPQVSLDIEFTDSELAYSEVLKGDIELAVITLAPQQDSHIQAHKIWPDPLCVAVAKDHELSTAGKIKLHELSDHPAILPNQNTYTGAMVIDLFAKAGVNLQISMATNYMETIKSMAGTGLGWTVLPESMLDDDLLRLDVIDFALARDLGCIHHKQRHLSNAATAFIDTLKAEQAG